MRELDSLHMSLYFLSGRVVGRQDMYTYPTDMFGWLGTRIEAAQQRDLNIQKRDLLMTLERKGLQCKLTLFPHLPQLSGSEEVSTHSSSQSSSAGFVLKGPHSQQGPCSESEGIIQFIRPSWFVLQNATHCTRGKSWPEAVVIMPGFGRVSKVQCSCSKLTYRIEV